MVNFIYIDGSGHKKARSVNTRDEYLALRNQPENAKNFYDARSVDKQAKLRLEQFNYNDQLPDGVLKGCCHPASTFAHDIDAYDIMDNGQLKMDNGSEAERIKDLILEKKEEIGLRMLERSVNGGFHLVCDRRPGTTILENQVRVATILKAEMDTNAHDLQRVMFTGPATKDVLLYLDDAIFQEPMSVEESEAEFQRLKEREQAGEEEVPEGAKKANKHYRPWESLTPNSSHVGEGNSEAKGASLLFKGTPYSSIIERWWERNGGEPQKGERNVKLYQLAVNLRAICDNNKALLLKIMPRLGLDEVEIKSIVDSACKETPKGISKPMREVLQSLDTKATPLTGEPAEGPTPPEMPTKLPKLIALLTSKTPDVYKAAVAHAVFPALGTHLCDVRFTYTDNIEHEATLMNCLMAGTGAGKGCIDEPIARIMADIKRRDRENERRESEWKKDCQKKGANKDKQLRPEGLVIQIIDPDMTKPALVMRMDESEGHFVYVKLNELDLFEQLKGQTGKQHFQLMCLAFDPGAEYGQTRFGTQSVTARPVCRFNWNACSTILKGRRFFRKVLTDGPISRINFCTIPEMEIGAEQPVYGKYDAAFDEALKPYIDNLVGARGLIDCPQAYKLAKKLMAECAEFARLSQNDTYWNLSHRACVIAWLKACVLYVANGQKWEKSIDEFIRWSLQYDLWCKMQFFGDDIDRANRGDDASIGKPGPKNLLELLPNEFTIEDAMQVRERENLDASQRATAHMIRTWKNRGYCAQRTAHSYKKSDKFTNPMV